MNKKGFTLVELLAVIVVLAILTGIAVPNVISTINNNKRRTFLMDAERMVAKAEYFLSSSRSDRNTVSTNGSITYALTQLNEKKEFSADPDGGTYQNASVTVTLSGGEYKYCIFLEGSKRKIGTSSSCVDSKSLTGIDIVKDK